MIDMLRPKAGVYAVTASIGDKSDKAESLPGVANIGDRPTVGGTDIGHACVGTDFKFGHARRGSAAMMEDVLTDSGVGVTFAQPVLDHEGEACSSTRIRAFLQSGEPQLAATLPRLA